MKICFDVNAVEKNKIKLHIILLCEDKLDNVYFIHVYDSLSAH